MPQYGNPQRYMGLVWNYSYTKKKNKQHVWLLDSLILSACFGPSSWVGLGLVSFLEVYVMLRRPGGTFGGQQNLSKWSFGELWTLHYLRLRPSENDPRFGGGLGAHEGTSWVVWSLGRARPWKHIPSAKCSGKSLT